MMPPTITPPSPSMSPEPTFNVDSFVSIANADQQHRRVDDTDIPTRDSQPIPTVDPSNYFQFKSMVDRLLTLAIMIAALPVMLFVSIAILVLDGRPILFHQTRVGKDGRLFRIHKFRTMQTDAERQTGAVWSSENDVRVTRLGRWLRCSHLDELPQLFNVLTGEMNLVGPRPERPEFVATLAEEVPGYLQRIQVNPGMTGLAQLSLGYDQAMSGIPRKVAHDLEYLESATFVKDMTFLALTVPYVARGLLNQRMGRQSEVTIDEGSETQQQSLPIHPLGIQGKQEPTPSPRHPQIAKYVNGEVA